MSDKKRVRVYMPKVNQNHFSNYTYQVGGPVNAPMQESPDISQDLADVIQMYAQATGMTEEEMQQTYQAILQMEPDQQSQVIIQMQKELESSMAANPMTAKRGGYIKDTKKLLSKKIGGISTNQTSKNVVDQMKQTFKDAVGEKVTRSILDEVAEENLMKANNMMANASNMFAASSQPRMDYGGVSNSMNPSMYMYGADNPFITDVQDQRMAFRDSIANLGSKLGQMSFRPVGDIKVKRRGDIFRPMQEGGSYFYQDAGNVTSGIALDENYERAFGDLNITDEAYTAAKKAYNDGATLTPQQQSIINRVDSYVAQMQSSPGAETSTDATATQTDASATGVNGWHGGYYWVNGVPVMSGEAMQQGANAITDFGSIFLPGQGRTSRIQGNLLELARNPEVIKQIGKGLTEFQPDNVYLSKAKARVNPFGAKAVFKWDYNDGQAPTLKDRFNNMFDREDEVSESTTGLKPKTGPLPQVPTENGSFRAAVSDTNIDLSNPSTYPKSWKSWFSPSYYDNITEEINEDMGKTMKYGGIPQARAGKMVIKQQFRPYGSDIAQSYSPFADAIASGLEMQGLQQQEDMAYLPDFYMPSIPMGPLSMGTKGTGPLIGKENRFATGLGLQGNYGDALYQNVPVYEQAASFGYQGYNRAYGGNIYQDGGMTDFNEGDYYEVSEDELADILKRGGKVQYY